MGGLFSKQKKEGGKKFYQFWAKDPQHMETKVKQDVTTNSTKVTNAEWTNVPLQVPDNILESLKKDIITVGKPVPPPRKHRGKSPSMKHVAELNLSNEIKPSTAVPSSPIPVEEPIIVPKKEPVHICDGTHHHVTNFVNGKIIQNSIITPKKNESISTPKHEKPMRPKNLSTVSLPNYEELAVQIKKRKDSLRNPNPKKKPTRHISVTSLPTENKVFLSSTTAARLENYMMRCKSFGALPPKQLLEKLQNEIDFGSESDDSWEGLDDWDMEVLEQNNLRHSPLVPRCRLSAPTHNPSIGSHLENRLPTTIEEVDEVTKLKVPSTPENQGIKSLKKREGRRESIDDFFDSKAENPVSTKIVKLKNDQFLGRRGSDGFFGYDRKCYPFKSAENDPSFKSDTFFSNSLLQSESEIKQDALKRRRKSAGAALHRIESYDDDDDEERLKSVVKRFDTDDDLLNTFEGFYNKDGKQDGALSKTDEERTTGNKTDEKLLPEDKLSMHKTDEEKATHGTIIDKKNTGILGKNKKVNDAPKSIFFSWEDNNDDETSANKSGTIAHSNLLKFIQENTIEHDNPVANLSEGINNSEIKTPLQTLPEVSERKHANFDDNDRSIKFA